MLWSSASAVIGASGRPPPATTPHELAIVDDVCRGVIATSLITASTTDLTHLVSQKPFIPSDLDRVLLLDLSARLDDMEDHLRFLLRDHSGS